MNIPHEISEELLARYFDQTVSETELDLIHTWVAQSPANARELDAFRMIWERSEQIGRHKKFNADLAWQRVRQKMEVDTVRPEQSQDAVFNRETKVKSLHKKKSSSFTLWAAAVVALMVAAFGWFQFKKEVKPELLSLTTKNNVREIYLPDGTKVFLNYNSTLSYPQSFAGDLRSVSLQGEAFFDVKRDPAHPFIIKANGTEIKVLGTSFNVKAYSKQPLRVDVSSGKVLVRNAKNELNLTKGQSAEVSNDSIRSILPDVNTLGYRTQVFDFNATQLNDVVSSIRNGYHADVRLSGEQISHCRLTIRFEKEPLDATLSVIAETLHLKIRKEGKTYWFEGVGCQ